jgi:hypothetical protein
MPGAHGRVTINANRIKREYSPSDRFQRALAVPPTARSDCRLHFVLIVMVLGTAKFSDCMRAT